MNESTGGSRDLQYLKGLARRLQANQAYMAWVLREYRRQERLDEERLATALNLDNAMLTRLALCRRPNSASPAFAEQIRQMSEYVGVDAGTLAGILRQVESLSALADLLAPVPQSEPQPATFAWRRGLLAAARDRTEESEPGDEEGSDEQGSDDAPDTTNPKNAD